jgi:hemin uptake protein HemP
MPELSSQEPPHENRREGQPPGAPMSSTIWHSEELFGDQRLVLIEHCGEVYRLQITARNRLVLRK